MNHSPWRWLLLSAVPLLAAPTCNTLPPQETGSAHPTIAGCLAPPHGLQAAGVREDYPPGSDCPERMTFGMWALTSQWVPATDSCTWTAVRDDMWPASDALPSLVVNPHPVFARPLAPTNLFGDGRIYQCSAPQYGIAYGDTGCTYAFTLCEIPEG